MDHFKISDYINKYDIKIANIINYLLNIKKTNNINLLFNSISFLINCNNYIIINKISTTVLNLKILKYIMCDNIINNLPLNLRILECNNLNCNLPPYILYLKCTLCNLFNLPRLLYFLDIDVKYIKYIPFEIIYDNSNYNNILKILNISINFINRSCFDYLLKIKNEHTYIF